MRSTMISSIFLVALSPIMALALPIDPNDQGGQWDPSGQYRKGHYDAQGNFIPDQGSNLSPNQVGWYQKGQYPGHEVYNHDQHNKGPWSNQQGQGNNDQYQNGQQHGAGQTWPAGKTGQTSSGWTDANGVWHSTDYSQGWTDANGVWHANPTTAAATKTVVQGGAGQDGKYNAMTGDAEARKGEPGKPKDQGKPNAKDNEECNGKEWNQRTGQPCRQAAAPVASKGAVPKNE
ncbi:Uncharacterized protein PECH_006383 [Penicillium ucsense]|uniref:Secreted protein n=1 Tax=Penicillium ucsense TaxID=2839758 RepID=A0A8J8W6X9_9EURO|nr:Uncharacterized protein PECM_006931 [Penicillium ucsense]KAF7735684.1 Uncharacterized protein PECH_006383 [Penicillium ucsense]